MARINVGRVVNGVDDSGKPIEFVLPDMVRALFAQFEIGDDMLIPLNMRDNIPSFWELGGRNKNNVSSIGTIISNGFDQLIDAILFNKLTKTPNGKQALMPLRPGYHLYAGRITIRHNALAPMIKMIRLVYEEIDDEASNNLATYGRFKIDRLFTKYGDIRGCLPGERLVEKLFACDVMKPYFANGWSMSDITTIENKEALKEAYARVYQKETPIQENTVANQFLDMVENNISMMNNQRLSPVFQYIDFKRNTMIIKPVRNVILADIPQSIRHAEAEIGFSIPLDKITECYNQNILIGSGDIGMLEVAMSHDDQFAIDIGDRVHVLLRGWRG